MDVREKQKALVIRTWDLMRPNLGNLSVRFFTAILDDIPEAKDMFHFLKDGVDDPQNNHKLRTHALAVFKLLLTNPLPQTCNSAVRLQENGHLALPDDALKKLGLIHLDGGVKDSHFEVMREALLATVREAVGGQWSDELSVAWAAAYDKLAYAIKMRMKE
ncbi:Non-symbiotic hemoglobin 2 [Platanthera zijinensis]|uniref:Non-symbiotic hemoglobin 2 n=1 Tax=Platanthera zijinensis TaxID=2320716 RepID=A0AAP0BVC7_9ASPA